MSNRHSSVAISAKAQKVPRPNRVVQTVLGVAALAVVAALIWLAQTSSVTSTPEVIGQPSATIDQTEFDYGDVKLGTTIETVFRVKNVGDQALVFAGEPIVEVVEGC